MSKTRKSKHDKKRKKHRQKQGKKARRPARARGLRNIAEIEETLNEAANLIENGDFKQARNKLEELNRRHPGRESVLRRLAAVQHKSGDERAYQQTCEELLKVAPNDPEVVAAVATTRLHAGRFAASLELSRHFLREWPKHKHASAIAEAVKYGEQALQEHIAALGLAGEVQEELLLEYDRQRMLMQQEKYEQAIQVGHRIVAKAPSFSAAQNAIAMAYFLQGDIEHAIEAGAKTLESKKPEGIDDFHAIVNMIHYLLLFGREDEAQKLGERLQGVQSDRLDFWVKKAEGLSYLGFDEAVLDTLEDYKKQGSPKEANQPELLHHLAAAAAARLGREEQARQLWQAALKIEPKFSPAEDNLVDLDRPASERSGPWTLPPQTWLPPVLADKLFRVFRTQAFDDDVKKGLRQLFAEHPAITHAIPLLLRYGEGSLVELIAHLARLADTPETREALREFCAGKHGSDRVRLQAARYLRQVGVLENLYVRMWRDGQWKETLVYTCEFHRKSPEVLPPEAQDLFSKAAEALNDNQPMQAEYLLKKALKIKRTPEMVNNLAVAYRMQGRTADADRLVRENYRRHPDYFTGCLAMAKLKFRDGLLEEAKEISQHLLTRQSLHVLEFRALCDFQIDLNHAEGNLDAAKAWLDFYEELFPNDPAMQQWKWKLDENPLSKLVAMSYQGKS